MHSLSRHLIAANAHLPHILSRLNTAEHLNCLNLLAPPNSRCQVRCLANMPPRQLLILEDVVLTAAHKPDRRLDELLAELFPDRFGSATGVKRAIRRREIILNGALARTDSIVQLGDKLQVVVKVGSAPVMPHASAGKESLEVAYEDEHFACVIKPQGIPTQGKGEGSVQGRVKYCLQPTHLPGALFRPHQVHRLDVGTGGLVLIAKTRAAVAALGTDLAAHNIQKRYLALVIGRLEGDGIISYPLQGKAAVSLYSAVQHSPSDTFGWLTWVSLWPQTGRTHQLRKHMAYMGHPILGDMQYKHHRKTDCQAVPVHDVQQYVPQLQDLVREVLPEQQAKMAAAAQAAAVQAAVVELQHRPKHHQQQDKQQQAQQLHSKSLVHNASRHTEKLCNRTSASIQMQAVATGIQQAAEDTRDSMLGSVQARAEVRSAPQDGNKSVLLYSAAEQAISADSSIADDSSSDMDRIADVMADVDGSSSSSIKGQVLKDGSIAQMCLWAVQLQLLHPITRDPIDLCINTPVKMYQHLCDVEAPDEQN